MKIIALIICLIFIVSIFSISGCIPEEKKEEKRDDISEIESVEQDIDPDNLGDISKEIDEVANW